MDEDETVGWSNPSALAIEAHEDSIRQTLAAQGAELAAMREAFQSVADHLRQAADKDKYGPQWRPLHYSAEQIEKVLIRAALGERRT